MTQTVVLRCLLEKPMTGQRCGFTEVDALLTALRADLMALQGQITPSVIVSTKAENDNPKQ